MANVSRTLRTAADLADAGLIAPEGVGGLEAVAARYAVAITPVVAELIHANDPDDPIARQFVPHEAELDIAPHEREDPIGDAAHSPVEGIVHRYPDRVLLTPVRVCAVYCRFCFRRETVGPGRGDMLSPAALDTAIDYIRARPEIWEVILSGGDPLVISPRRLRALVGRLASIDHVKVLRVHTRIPAVDPARVTPALVSALKSFGKAAYVVLHANHPRELTPAAREACARIIDGGIPMLGQSVLLRGINSDPKILTELMRGFVECRIKPYYLHHADLAPGTAHLRTTIAEGQELMRALRGHVSGLCQPTYVLDIPGGHGKVPIGPDYMAFRADGRRDGDGPEVTDHCGVTHAYADPHGNANARVKGR
jgi:lysine 2,3-aminomutase